jgi:cell wall-associated NlpC family hydrolase
MLEEYFAIDCKQQELLTELKSWLRTPYRHWSGVKGKGVDCIHFVAKSMENVGALQGKVLIIQKYPHDWHLHRGEPLLKEGIERHFNHIMIKDKDALENGDIILYKYGRQAAHSAIYFDGDCYQALNGSVVHTRSYRDSDFYDRVRFIYRVIKI